MRYIDNKESLSSAMNECGVISLVMHCHDTYNVIVLLPGGPVDARASGVCTGRHPHGEADV